VRAAEVIGGGLPPYEGVQHLHSIFLQGAVMMKHALPALSLCAVLLLLCASDLRAQERSAGAALGPLTLDTLGGPITVYYTPEYAERARALQPRYAAVLSQYEAMFAHDTSMDFRINLAVLGPEHWAAVTPLPYGLPHINTRPWSEALVLLPGAGDQGVMAEAYRRQELPEGMSVEAMVDMIGFHEFGHGVVIKHLYSQVPDFERTWINWFDEFMASYMGTAHLMQSEGTSAIRAAEMATDVDPTYRSLSAFDEHYEEFSTPDGIANLNWYQGQFAQRVAAVFAKQGLDFVRRVHDELPWSRYAEWTTEELLGWLEMIEPGFLAWAQSLERKGAGPGE
jgi:hypothetical protein